MQALRSLLKNYLGYRYQKLRHYDDRNRLPPINTFAGRPTELLLMIIDHLPLVDLACLSFCNHRLLELSRWGMNRLDCNKNEKLLVLARLEQAFPQYFACRFCHILHKYDGSESFGLSVLPSRKCPTPCYSNFIQSLATLRTHGILSFLYGEVSFLHVKLAMKRFSHGAQCGINIDSLRYTEIRPIAPDSIYSSVHSETTSLFSCEAQICPNHPQLGLCMRLQDIMLANSEIDLIPTPITEGSEDTILWEHLSLSEKPLHMLEVCRHISTIKLIPGIMELLHGTGTGPGGRTTFQVIPHSCEDCNTDSCIEVQRFNSQTALILTKWVALGHGISEEDPLWKSHTYWDTGNVEKVNAGSPRMCFESIAPESFRDLMFRNFSSLKDKRYQKEARFRRYGSYRWVAAYEEPKKPPFHSLKKALPFMRSIEKTSTRN